LKIPLIDLFLYRFNLFTFLACTDRSSEILTLKEENKILHHKIDSIIEFQKNYTYRPIVVANSTELKLGEEYIADIRLSIFNKLNPPIVLRGKIDDSSHVFIPNGDTLPVSQEYETTIYKVTPKEIGRYEWHGEIISNIPNVKYPFPFSMSFNVRK
jgi:hypothetical protein